MTTPHNEPLPLSDRLGADQRNVLVQSSPMDDRSDAACADLLSAARSTDQDVLFVSLAGSPDDRLERLRADAGGAHPAKLAVVVAGEPTRSAAGAVSPSHGPSPRITTVSSPGDLTGLGIEISEQLEAWADDGNPTVVCFHTLTTLFQYVDLEPAFQFLHVLTARVRIADARAHYHVDPAAHDERELNTMRTLFDAVVESSDDGWTVRTR